MATEYFSRAVAPVSRMYRLNEYFFNQALEGLSEADLWRRPSECANPMFWIAGHMTDSRAMVLKALGEEFELPWGGQFKRFSKISQPSDYPALAQIRSTMESSGIRIKQLLLIIEDDRLFGPASGVGVPNAKTLMDEISQLAWHDSYHLGQLGYLRVALGFPGIVG